MKYLQLPYVFAILLALKQDPWTASVLSFTAYLARCYPNFYLLRGLQAFERESHHVFLWKAPRAIHKHKDHI